MEAAHCYHGASGGGRAQRRMVLVALPERHQEAGDDRLVHTAQVGDALPGEEAEIAAQVPAVRRERVLRQAALDGEVVQVGPDRLLQLRRTRRRGSAQAGTPSKEADFIPCASATGA